MASLLDGMEDPRVGQPLTVPDMISRHLKIDLCVTGTGAINHQGLRFGKGHGFFDLEWDMLYSLGVVSSTTTCIAVCYECQVDQDLHAEEFDTFCDFMITDRRAIDVAEETARQAMKPTCGILWDKLQPGMLEDIPPLRELKERNDPSFLR